MLVVLRCTPADDGAQCVMMDGTSMMLMLLVISWDLDLLWKPTAVQHLEVDPVPSG